VPAPNKTTARRAASPSTFIDGAGNMHGLGVHRLGYMAVFGIDTRSISSVES